MTLCFSRPELFTFQLQLVAAFQCILLLCRPAQLYKNVYILSLLKSFFFSTDDNILPGFKTATFQVAQLPSNQNEISPCQCIIRHGETEKHYPCY